MQCQSVVSSRRPQGRKEREDKGETHSDSKEQREARPEGPADSVSEDEAQASSQRKRGQRVPQSSSCACCSASRLACEVARGRRGRLLGSADA